MMHAIPSTPPVAEVRASGCFTDEVMAQKFPTGFKLINVVKYDGSTDPSLWLEDYILVVHVADGNDLHAIKYLPLKLKGSALHWLHTLPLGSIGTWDALEAEFMAIFYGTYVNPPYVDDLAVQRASHI